MTWVAAAVLIVAAACTRQGVLAELTDEPLLGTPPDGVELVRTETAGSSVGFQSPARIEIIWGVPDDEVALAWYLEQFGEQYRLAQQGTEPRYLGGRDAGEIGVTASVRTFPSMGDIKWDALIAEEAPLDWDGPVVVVRVSSDG